MRTDGCREWREEIGAYALGQLSAEEGAALEAHIEGCPDCRAEVESLASVARMLPLADPERFVGPAPQPPAALADRVTATIAAERRAKRRRRAFRIGVPAIATAAAVAAALAIFVLPGGGGNPEQHVSFADVPHGVKIGATLEPQAFGTEIRMYVKGIRSGTLCRVFMRGQDGSDISAGTFRYRWGGDASATLSSALDISRAKDLVVHAGPRTFVAPIDSGKTAWNNQPPQEAT